MNDFGAELGHLGADVRLGHNDPGADYSDDRQGEHSSSFTYVFCVCGAGGILRENV